MAPCRWWKRVFVRLSLLGFLVWFTVCVLLYHRWSETTANQLNSAGRAEQPGMGAWPELQAQSRDREPLNNVGRQLRPTIGASASVEEMLGGQYKNRSTRLKPTELALRHEPVVQREEGPSTLKPSRQGENKPVSSSTLDTISLMTPTPEGSKVCGHWGHNSTSGFALSLSFWDQQTWSCGNLLGFQRWASSIGMVVVEPFMIETKFQIPSREIMSSDLPMSKLYDMEYWNGYSLKNGYAPVVTWKCFIHKAPRQLILVHLKRSGKTCSHNDLRSKTKMLVAYGFQVVREHCIAAPIRKAFPLPEFNRQVLGNFTAHNVTVVFQEWSQYTAGDNLDIFEVHVPVALMKYLPIRANREVLDDTDAYIRRYLDSGFVAILLRVEWLVMNAGNEGHMYSRLHYCVNKTLKYLAAAKQKAHATSVFVGMDIGKYGSTTFSRLDQFKQYIGENFLNVIYPESNMTISQWEHTFEDVSRSKVPGYIALVQKEVATRGACLLLIGQGSFHKQALTLYQEHHSKSEMCYLTTSSHCEVDRIAGFRVN